MIIVKSQIKSIAKDNGIDNVSADFADKLNKEALAVIARACSRAKSNMRRTVMGKDI